MRSKAHTFSKPISWIVDTDENDGRLELIHDNIRKYATV